MIDLKQIIKLFPFWSRGSLTPAHMSNNIALDTSINGNKSPIRDDQIKGTHKTILMRQTCR